MNLLCQIVNFHCVQSDVRVNHLFEIFFSYKIFIREYSFLIFLAAAIPLLMLNFLLVEITSNIGFVHKNTHTGIRLLTKNQFSSIHTFQIIWFISSDCFVWRALFGYIFCIFVFFPTERSEKHRIQQTFPVERPLKQPQYEW